MKIYNNINRKKICVVLVVLTSLFASCLPEDIQVGREEDTKEGVKLLEAFYSNISNKHYEKIDAMVADSLKKYVGKHGISKMIIGIQNKVGVYKGYNIEEAYTGTFDGQSPETIYKYKLKVNFEKKAIGQYITFVRSGDKVQLVYFENLENVSRE
jgi:hypothetical protein